MNFSALLNFLVPEPKKYLGYFEVNSCRASCWLALFRVEVPGIVPSRETPLPSLVRILLNGPASSANMLAGRRVAFATSPTPVPRASSPAVTPLVAPPNSLGKNFPSNFPSPAPATPPTPASAASPPASPTLTGSFLSPCFANVPTPAPNAPPKMGLPINDPPKAPAKGKRSNGLNP